MSHYPIYSLLEALFKLLSDIENLDQLEATPTNNYGLATLQENICTSIMKIVIAFSDTIDNDFRRVEMRPYFERFQKILANWSVNVI